MDALLVGRVLRGDRDAYAGLVQQHQAALYRYALAMVHDPDVAADHVQDAFVKAYQSLRTCQDPHRFAPWIFRILRNRCADYLKERRRKDLPLDPDAPFASAAPDPMADLERAQLQTQIAAAIGTLPDAQREAFVLKHVQGLSYEEMAEHTGVGMSALKMRVLRAREALAQLLQPSR